MTLAAGLTLGLAGCNGKAGGNVSAGPPPAVPVAVAKVAEKTVPVEFRTFGLVEANQTAAIKSQIGGVLTKVGTDAAPDIEGRIVKEGEALFEIDSRPYESALKSAEANEKRDTAQFVNASAELNRQKELLDKHIASPADYDLAKATADALDQAVQADKIAVQRALLDISYCKIAAPFKGRLGALMVNKGNLVSANGTTLIVINQIEPVKVTFSVPQSELAEIQKQAKTQTLHVKAILPGLEDKPEIGDLVFIDNTINTASGTVQLKASFKNDNERLWPGRYVDVVLVLTEQKGALCIPSQAILSGQKGSYVYVVKPDNTVEDRVVTVGRTLDGETVISDGLKPNETVVVDGQLRLKPGASVEIKPAVDANLKLGETRSAPSLVTKPAAAPAAPAGSAPASTPAPAPAKAGEGTRL